MDEYVLSKCFRLEKPIIIPQLFELPGLINIINGILLSIIIIIIICNYSLFKKLDIYNKIMILIALGIYLGIHGLLHLGLEKIKKIRYVDIIEKKN